MTHYRHLIQHRAKPQPVTKPGEPSREAKMAAFELIFKWMDARDAAQAAAAKVEAADAQQTENKEAA